MGRKRNKLLSPFFSLVTFLIFVLIVTPTIVSADVFETFPYNPIFWETWDSEGSGSINWREQNSTVYLNTESTGAYQQSAITRAFDIDEGEDTATVEYLYRATEFSNGTYSASSWYNTSFSYRKSHTITGTALGAQTDYQMCIELRYGAGTDTANIIYLDSKTQTDFDDIRFTKNDHTTLLDCWRQNYTASTVAFYWVEIDSIPASPSTVTIYVYYGCPDATSVSDGEATFIVFDDFDDNSLNSSLWTSVAGTGGSVQETGNELAIQSPSGATSASYVTCLTTIPINVAITFTARDSYESNPCHIYRGLWIIGVPWVNASWFMAGILRDGSLDQAKGLRGTGSGQYLFEAPADCYTNDSVLIRLTTGDVAYYNDHSASANKDYTADSPSYPESFGFFAHYAAGQETFYVLDLFIRNYVLTEPTHTATGSENGYGSLHKSFETSLNYRSLGENVSISLQHNATDLLFNYYNWSSTYTTLNYSFSGLSVNYDDYLRVKYQINSYSRTLTLTIEDITETNVLTQTVYVDVVVPRLVGFTFNASSRAGHEHTYANVSSEIVWIEAPFSGVDFIREWREAGDVDNDDTAYFIDSSSASVMTKNFTAKVIPFQGFKALWNWSSGQFHWSIIQFEFYDNNGSLTGLVNFFVETSDPTTVFVAVDTLDDGTPTTLGHLNIGTDYVAAIAIWVDEGDGNLYAYIQEDPESHTFCDFRIWDVSEYFDFTSWGCVVKHSMHTEVAGAYSVLKEAEIFAGRRTGISQPRFGGMVWLYNPFLAFFYWLASVFYQVGQWLAAALAPIITAVGTFLRPYIEAVTGAVSGLATWLSNQLDTLLDVVDILGGIAASIATEIVNNVIVPAVTALFNWIIANFLNSIFYAVLLAQGVLDFILRAISTWFWGDADILPNLLVGANLFIFELIRGTGYFLISGNISAIGFYLLGMLQGFASPIGYATMGLGTIPDMIMMSLFWFVSYAPALFFIYITITLLNVMMEFINGNFDFQAFAPLWAMFLFFWRLGEYAVSLIRTVLNLIWNLITAIMELIPF
jgi:hypothetical protein